MHVPLGMPVSTGDVEKDGVVAEREKIRLLRPYTFALAAIVSIGGFIFGYDTGQISGFLEMPDFLRRFGNVGDSPSTYAFTDAVSGTIVGLLSIGTMFGALCSAPVADKFGRKVCIVFWNIMFCVGVVVQMTAEYKWYQVALGRWVAGLGVGGLSVLTPMYQSETAPRYIRGAMVGCYQLFITLGIFVAYCINFGTERNPDASAWRIPMGVGFIPPALMIVGISFLPESPRWDYRHNNIERARRTIARSYGVTISHWEVEREMREIKEKHDADPFITSAIDFQYGYIFASCCFISIPIVYFFLEEHQGRALEEIDTMYITHVSPRKSSKWQPPQGEEVATADALYLEPGARGIKKADAAGMEGEERNEDLQLPPAPDRAGIHDESGVGVDATGMGGVRGMSYSGPHGSYKVEKHVT
ncbi:hypothetical protein BST61_g3684 [Cercospora zeina]